MMSLKDQVDTHGNIVLRSREEARVDYIGEGAVGVELAPYERA